MAFETLHVEHPTLSGAADSLVSVLQTWHDEVHPSPGASSWLHHNQFTERSEHLAGHLSAVLTLADRGWHQSALALTRTALEHHLLDRLLLLADRYEEIVRPDDPALLQQWESEWTNRSEPWTDDVISVERAAKGRALRLTRLAHAVKGEDGLERERISPYWVAMDHYDAFVGHPDQQASTVRPFDDLETRLAWARQNQALYGSYMRWSSICHNLDLSSLIRPGEILQLHVHYGFLSAFTHATQTGYDLHLRPHAGGPPAEHVLSELSLLYVCTIAIAELDAWATYIDKRPLMLDAVSPIIVDLLDELRPKVSYFWFLGGRPQDFDRYQEANRRAHPLLLTGRRPEIAPNQLSDADVGYYDRPLERLQRLHTGETEGTTGFGYRPLWPRLRW